MDEKTLKQEIIAVGKKLHQAGLAVAKSGNLSAKIDQNNIFITATGTSLGSLKEDELIKVNLRDKNDLANPRLSSEFPLHKLIYENLDTQVVVHCHPPLANGYFAVTSDLKALIFEAKLSLGDVRVVEQETPSITKPELVIEALKNNNLAVIKNHGAVALGKNFTEAVNLVEMLEEAIKVASIARLFHKEALDELDVALKQELTKNDTAYPMFSREHIQAIVDLVNKDEFISQKGKELDLTVRLAVKLDNTDKAYTFNFEKGRITKLDNGADAPFIISGQANVWEQVFLGKLDSFVAVTQGKMKLQGQLGQLSKWYVPFTKLFGIFKQVRFR